MTTHDQMRTKRKRRKGMLIVQLSRTLTLLALLASPLLSSLPGDLKCVVGEAVVEEGWR